MLPAANLHLRGLYDTTVDFFVSRSPTSIRGPLFSDSDQDTRSSASSPVARPTLREFDNRNSVAPGAGHTMSSMRRELDDTKRDLSKTKLEVTRLEGRCAMLEKMLKDTREMLKARDAEVHQLRSGNMDSPPIMQRQTAAGSSRALDLEDVPSSLPDEEDSRRRASEVFMARTDICSGAQVLQAVHDLNSEILQFAATATELCTFRQKQTVSSSRFGQATDDTALRMGRPVTLTLSTRDHSQDPMLVQLAMQGAIVVCIHRALTAFCMGFPSKQDGVLAQIYSHMYSAVPQPTSSRWRALTVAHIHVMYPYLADYAVNELCESIYRYCSDILLLSGCTGNPSDRTSLSSREGLRSRFGDQVRRLARSVCKLSTLTRQEIFSANFELLLASHNDSFDMRKMEDAFAAYVPSKGPILATTEFGLRWTTRRSDTGTVGKNDIETRILLKPKVVVESVLDLVDL